jgi:hypothetical protein
LLVGPRIIKVNVSPVIFRETMNGAGETGMPLDPAEVSKRILGLQSYNEAERAAVNHE